MLLVNKICNTATIYRPYGVMQKPSGSWAHTPLLPLPNNPNPALGLRDLLLPLSVGTQLKNPGYISYACPPPSVFCLFAKFTQSSMPQDQLMTPKLLATIELPVHRSTCISVLGGAAVRYNIAARAARMAKFPAATGRSSRESDCTRVRW